MDYSNESRRTGVVPGALERNPSFIRRISWGAVIAGFLIAVVVNLTLNLLGIGIGLGAIDPMAQDAIPSGIGIGSIIWYAISTIISLLAGGWVAAHLSGVPDRKDSMMHGVLTWCLFTIFSFYLLTTAVGKIIGVTGSVVGSAFSLVGQGVQAVAPEAADAVKEQMNQSDISVQSIKQEAEQLLRQTGKKDLQPENLENAAQQAGQQVKQTADNPGQIDQVLSRVLSGSDSIINDVDKEAIVNVLVARTDQSRAEAQKTVNNWAGQYQQAKQKITQVKQQATAQAKETAEKVSSAISSAAIAGFIGLVVGAISGAIGGALGRPKDRVVEYA